MTRPHGVVINIDTLEEVVGEREPTLAVQAVDEEGLFVQ
jgi:hypothetical protein